MGVATSIRGGVLSFETEYDRGLLARTVDFFFCHRDIAVAFRREWRYPKFEVLGSIFRKPRPSPVALVSLSYPAGVCSCCATGANIVFQSLASVPPEWRT